MKREAPGLPPRLIDEREDSVVAVESTWDTLARAAIEIVGRGTYSKRVRVRWRRRTAFHWCCAGMMRLGRLESQPKALTFGWEREELSDFAACGKCGRVKDVWLCLFK
jgi:hypothetical protein